MYIKFESHEKKLVASLAAFPAYLLMIICLPQHSFAIPSFIALAVCLFFMWKACETDHSALDVFISSLALGASIGFVCNLAPESKMLITELKRDIGLSHGSRYIDQYDVISALGFTALLGVLTCLRIDAVEKKLPERIKQPTYPATLILFTILVAMDFTGVMHSSPLFYLISSTLALLVIGRDKESLLCYGVLSIPTLQAVLVI